MRALLALLVLVVASAAAQAETLTAAMKGPLSYSLEQYGLVLVVSLLSGLASWLAKLRKGLVPAWSLSSLLGESLTSVLAGLVTFWLAEWQGLHQLLTIALVALSGHAGGEGLKLLERLAQKRIERLVGDGSSKPAPLDDGKG